MHLFILDDIRHVESWVLLFYHSACFQVKFAQLCTFHTVLALSKCPVVGLTWPPFLASFSTQKRCQWHEQLVNSTSLQVPLIFWAPLFPPPPKCLCPCPPTFYSVFMFCQHYLWAIRRMSDNVYVGTNLICTLWEIHCPIVWLKCV